MRARLRSRRGNVPEPVTLKVDNGGHEDAAEDSGGQHVR